MYKEVDTEINTKEHAVSNSKQNVRGRADKFCLHLNRK